MITDDTTITTKGAQAMYLAATREQRLAAFGVDPRALELAQQGHHELVVTPDHASHMPMIPEHAGPPMRQSPHDLVAP